MIKRFIIFTSNFYLWAFIIFKSLQTVFYIWYFLVIHNLFLFFLHWGFTIEYLFGLSRCKGKIQYCFVVLFGRIILNYFIVFFWIRL